MHYRRELDTAREICTEVGLYQLTQQPEIGAAERKDDGSPVTEVDRTCERMVLERLNKAFPSDGLLGEESGDHPGTSGRRWIVDPLDGTRPFIRGIPTYSVLLALEDEGVPVVGVIELPALGLSCWAAQGRGACLNGERIRVSSTERLEQAMGSALGFVESGDESVAQRLLGLMRRWDYVYGFMDAYSYVCVASGRIDLCVNLLDKAWDSAAAACIVEEAGGKYSDISGARTVHGGSFVVSNGLLHDSVLRELSAPSSLNKETSRT
jgi:histidinol-phosphatase